MLVLNRGFFYEFLWEVRRESRVQKIAGSDFSWATKFAGSKLERAKCGPKGEFQEVIRNRAHGWVSGVRRINPEYSVIKYKGQAFLVYAWCSWYALQSVVFLPGKISESLGPVERVWSFACGWITGWDRQRRPSGVNDYLKSGYRAC